MTKLFVGGLPYTYNDQNLRDLFAEFGEILSAVVVIDRFTNRSKGFGFVEMADDNAAQEAIKALDGSDLDGRKLGVSVARPREDRPRTNSGFGSDRRDFNRGSNNRDSFRRDRR